MTLTLVYPDAADTYIQKLYFLYRVQRKIQIVHDIQGTKFRNMEISEYQWRQFLTNWFFPRSNLIGSEICRIRKIARNKKWNFPLNSIFVEVK